jgi:hypothetical protein
VTAVGGELSGITGDALVGILVECFTDGHDGAKCLGVTFSKGGVGGSPGSAE